MLVIITRCETKRRDRMKFVLRPRQKNLQGIPNWHDSVVLQWALDRIGHGKPLSQMGVWLGLAKKIRAGSN